MKMNKELKLFNLMVAHDAGNSHRIQHFMKVYGFAIKIAELEKEIFGKNFNVAGLQTMNSGLFLRKQAD